MIEWNSKEMWELFNDEVTKVRYYPNEQLIYDKSNGHINAGYFGIVLNANGIKTHKYHDYIEATRPKPEPKVGQFGKFWDDNNVMPFWGVLKAISPSGMVFYPTNSGNNFDHFEAGLPEGFDKEGNPI